MHNGMNCLEYGGGIFEKAVLISNEFNYSLLSSSSDGISMLHISLASFIAFELNIVSSTLAGSTYI